MCKSKQMWRKERKVGREGERIRRGGRDGGTARKEKRQDASPAARGVRNQVAAADRFLYDTQTRRFCGPARGENTHTHTHTRCTYLWAQYIRDGCQPQTVHFCMYENSTCDCENDRSDWYDCVRERSFAAGRAENSFFVDALYTYLYCTGKIAASAFDTRRDCEWIFEHARQTRQEETSRHNRYYSYAGNHCDDHFCVTRR